MKQSLQTRCLLESEMVNNLNVLMGKWFHKLQNTQNRHYEAINKNKSICTNKKCVSVYIFVFLSNKDKFQENKLR